MRIRKCLAAGLVAALILPAQQTTPPKPPESGGLKIVVVQGEGAKNNIRSRTATAPVVEVRDSSDKPVSGAEVVFQLPSAGPSGNFYGWLKMQTVKTDENGRAAATGYTPNDEEGRFNIKVVASSGNATTSAVIAQSNVSNGNAGSSARSSRPGWWKWAAVLGGAAVAGGVVAATRGGSTSSAATATSRPISIGAGAITVGGPR
ncbi:MAG: hypothetical protein NZV14_11335 [Bryobacteraceae bacterium]|nr:hypothetical protein [Bryobacteraceae bacterium]MDW8378746.1 hypothetical protein [Bryobacterales bacterium]